MDIYFSLTLKIRGRKSLLRPLREALQKRGDPETHLCLGGLVPFSLDITSLSCHPQELSELKDQIQDVEGKYMQGLKEMKVPVHGAWARHINPA